MSTYTTIAGDTWDIISKRVYGDDHAFPILMDANQQYIETLIFDGGIILNVPDIENENTEDISTETDAALWRDSMS